MGTRARAISTHEETFCFCVGLDKEPHNPSEWFMLNITNGKNKEEEKNG